jgi:hypothetical protein
MGLRGVISLSLFFHGRVELACIGGHTRTPAKPHKSGVYNYGEVSYLSGVEDPASPTLAGRYVVACTAFYERGFGVPSHRFLHFLLQFYGLELHHLTSSRFTGCHPVPQPKWGMMWLSNTSLGYNPYATSSSSCYEVG